MKHRGHRITVEIDAATNSTNLYRAESDTVNSDGTIIRNYRKTVESLTLHRTKGHKTFCEVLRKMEIPADTIKSIRMAPNLYADDQEWLEWLWMIQQDPYNIPLERFLSLSGSKVSGETTGRAILDWKSARGQEELVHKAIRVVYPKPDSADLFPWLLLGFFYILGLPGSIFVFLVHHASRCCKIYIPYSVLWTISGAFLAFPALLFWDKLLKSMQMLVGVTASYRILIPLVGFSSGLLLAGILVIIGTVYYRYHLEESWIGGKSHNGSVKLHYAENRSLANLFKLVFGVDLPSYTSHWVYAVMCPLLAIVPSAIGLLLMNKVWANPGSEGEANGDHYPLISLSTFKARDLVTWIGVIGGNLLVFVKLIRFIAKFALFRDPVLQRLTCQNPR